MAHPVDVYVGSRLKDKRTSQGLSQSEIGRYLGVTFQQVQKYEKGVNRISPSYLYEVSKLLKTPINYFFDGYEECKSQESLTDDNDFVSDEYSTDRENLRLIKDFSKIENPKVRKKISSLVRTLIKNEE